MTIFSCGLGRGLNKVENKGFPGVGVVLATALTLGFFVFKRTAGTGQSWKNAKSSVDGSDIGYVVETGLLKGVSS